MFRQKQKCVLFNKPIYQVITQRVEQFADSTQTTYFKVETDKLPEQPPFNEYSFEDMLRAGVALDHVNTKVLTPERLNLSALENEVQPTNEE